MHNLIKSMTLRQLLVQQVPCITFSIIIAELFYKFHSFTLECLAFLVTWYVADLGFNTLTRLIAGPTSNHKP